MTEKILIIDFGSQYTQLIARRVRECEVYCEIHPYNKIPQLTPDIKGIIHFAASKAVGESVQKPLLYYRNNLNSLINLLDTIN